MVLRFDVDVGKMLQYLESKRDESAGGSPITLTHVAVKAVALTLMEMSFLKGHVVNGTFYAAKQSSVAVSMSVELADADSAVVTIGSADKISVSAIAKEARKLTAACVANNDGSSDVQSSLLSYVSDMCATISRIAIGKYGICIPGLPCSGSTPFPYGSATVIRMITTDASDADIDLTLIPDMSDSSCPVTVTIGGVKLIPHQKDRQQAIPAHHHDKYSSDHNKMRFKQMLKVTVCIDSHAASLQQAQRFVSKLKEHMNSPRSLD
jgi:pyruvate/2-oxoglutarate dehydrogenase complex dihydrolipoamide acyltransferase (E2) component